MLKFIESVRYAGLSQNKVKFGFSSAEGATHVLPPTKARLGFTLAEVLITLGIIGVVAALTIPTLMTAHKKHVTAAKLKRAVSSINQAIKLSESENGEVENWDRTLTQKEFVDKYFRPYMKIAQVCNPVTDCGYKSDAPWSYLNGATHGSYSSPNHGGRTPFLTLDGFLYAYSAYSAGSDSITGDNDRVIIVDINGAEKPNQLGKDVFFLYRIEEEDSIIPYGADKSDEEIRKSCSKNGNGFYCAALIRANGWEIPNSYPW